MNTKSSPWTVEAPVFRQVGVPMAMEEITVLPPCAGEVAVRLAAGGVCHSCLHSIDGSLAGTPLPIVLGDEGAGIVVETGEGVTGVAPGDHVVLSWAQLRPVSRVPRRSARPLYEQAQVRRAGRRRDAFSAR